MKSDYIVNLWQVYGLMEYSKMDPLHGGCGLIDASWPLDGYKLIKCNFKIDHLDQL